MSEDNERWLSDGNCMLCRRDPYCQKPCTAQKRRKEAILQAMIRNRTGIDKMREVLKGADDGGVV